jgi:hypothetical protein
MPATGERYIKFDQCDAADGASAYSGKGVTTLADLEAKSATPMDADEHSNSGSAVAELAPSNPFGLNRPSKDLISYAAFAEPQRKAALQRCIPPLLRMRDRAGCRRPLRYCANAQPAAALRSEPKGYSFILSLSSGARIVNPQNFGRADLISCAAVKHIKSLAMAAEGK